MSFRSARCERGQASVELAIIAPLNVFLLLGILQLGMMQHAQLLTEYAAFCAARSGAVMHGNPAEMRRAAFLALMPTFTRVYYPNGGTLPNVLLKMKLYEDQGMKPFLATSAALQSRWIATSAAAANEAKNDAQFEFIRIEVVRQGPSGAYSTLGRNVNAGSSSPEIDFDDVSSANAVASNLLSVRLTYYYVMRIPFANWTIYNSWLASRLAVDLNRHLPGELSPVDTYSRARAMALLQTGSANAELTKLRKWAALGMFVLPIRATWTTRMQSSQFQKYMP